MKNIEYCGNKMKWPILRHHSKQFSNKTEEVDGSFVGFKPHGATIQRTAILVLAAMRISNLKDRKKYKKI
jgi:hypothetical protein